MVLAKTKHLDIPHDNHLIVVLGKDRIVDHIYKPLLVTLGHPQQGLGISLWGALQSFPVRVLANAFKHGSESRGEELHVGGLLFGSGVQTEMCRLG